MKKLTYLIKIVIKYYLERKLFKYFYYNLVLKFINCNNVFTTLHVYYCFLKFLFVYFDIAVSGA